MTIAEIDSYVRAGRYIKNKASYVLKKFSAFFDEQGKEAYKKAIIYGAFPVNMYEIQNGQWELGDIYYVTKIGAKFDEAVKMFEDSRYFKKAYTWNYDFSLGIIVIRAPEATMIDLIRFLKGEYYMLFLQSQHIRDQLYADLVNDPEYKAMAKSIYGEPENRAEKLELLSHLQRRIEKIFGEKIELSILEDEMMNFKSNNEPFVFELAPIIIEDAIADKDSVRQIISIEEVRKQVEEYLYQRKRNIIHKVMKS